MANSLELKATRALVSSAAETSLTRDALLAQGIAFVFGLSAWGLSWVNDPQATSLSSLCGTAAFVISMWAVVNSLRAVRRGERSRIPAAIVGLSVAVLGGWSVLLWERLLAPSVYSTPTYKTLCELAAPVLFPALAFGMLLAVLDAWFRLYPGFSLRMLGLQVCAAIFAVCCITIAPAALFLMAALNTHEKIGIAWQAPVIEHTPDFIAASVDRVCARVPYLQQCHYVLGQGDFLPETRVIENLQDDAVAFKSSERLFKLNREAYFGEAVKAASGKMYASDLMLSKFAIKLGYFGSLQHIEAALNHCAAGPNIFYDALAGNLRLSGGAYRTDVFPALSRAVLRGRLHRPLAIQTVAWMYHDIHPTMDERQLETGRLYDLWTYFEHDWQQSFEMRQSRIEWTSLSELKTYLSNFEETAALTRSKYLAVRRKATLVLAHTFDVPIEGIPPDDPEPEAESVPESAGEIAERNEIIVSIERVIQPVRTEVAARDWKEQIALLELSLNNNAKCKSEWAELLRSNPIAALKIATQAAIGCTHIPELNEEFGTLLAERGDDQFITSLLNSTYEPTALYRGLICSLGQQQRTKFLPQLWELSRESPDWAVSAIESACLMDCEANVERELSALMNDKPESRLAAAYYYGLCRDEELRVKIAEKLLDSNWADGYDWDVVEITMSSAIFCIHPREMNDAGLRYRWIERLARELDNKDIVVQRGATVCLAKFLSIDTVAAPELDAPPTHRGYWRSKMLDYETDNERKERKQLRAAAREWLENNKNE
jgi:hypothetical protein